MENLKMKTITTRQPSAQGDLLIRRIDTLPKNLIEAGQEPEGPIVAHSETGHHHQVQGGKVRYLTPSDTGPESSLVAYLEVLSEHADLVHLRGFDTHETLRLPRGTWELRRQREHTPEGWRRVED